MKEDEVRDLSLFFMIRFLLYQKRSMHPVDVFEVVLASGSEDWCHTADEPAMLGTQDPVAEVLILTEEAARAAT